MKPNITQKNRLTYDELRVMRIVEEYFRRHIYMTEKELDQLELSEREWQSISDWMAKYYPSRIYKTEVIDENTHEVSDENQVITCEYDYKGERHACVLIQRLAEGYIKYEDGQYGFLYFPIVNPIKHRNAFESLPSTEFAPHSNNKK